MTDVSVIIPAFNEAAAVGATVRALRDTFAGTPHVLEVIVVDDGSSDDTAAQAEAAGALVLQQPFNTGYGNAILAGVRRARHAVVAITDADGTYPVGELPALLEEFARRRLDMIVGARRGKHYRGSLAKRLARCAFKRLSEFTVGRHIPDINSGLRVMRRDLVLAFAPVLCGGFSFTTTLTVVAMLTHHHVDYREVEYFARTGASKVRYFRDTLRAAQILVMAILLFNPIKMFLAHAAGTLLLGATVTVAYLLVPSAWQGGVVLAGASLFAVALIVALGFVAEQSARIAAFRNRQDWDPRRKDESARSPAPPDPEDGRDEGSRA